MTFGACDGLNGACGLIFGLLHGHATRAALAVAVVASAGSNTWSMAGGEFTADEEGNTREQITRALIMAIAFFIAAFAPGSGYLFSREAGNITLAVFTPMILGAIVLLRLLKHRWLPAILTVGIVFALAAGTGYLATVIAPSSGG